MSIVQHEDGSLRIAVIDGLGHGPEAYAVAKRAIAALEARPLLGPAEALQLCHETLRGTRGAAISVAHLTPAATGAAGLTFSGVGNVEAMLAQPDSVERPICYRGIVGVTPRTPRAFNFELRAGWTFVIFSDGMRARFTVTDLEGANADPSAVAARLLAEWSRPTDDATIVVAVADLA